MPSGTFGLMGVITIVSYSRSHYSNIMKELSDSDLLSRVYIAAPCSVSWDSMEGDDVVRHCGQCRLNVYNFEELTSKEVADIIRNAEGRVCGRLFKRFDGTIITKNCPKGISYIKAFYRVTLSIIFATLVWFGFMNDAQAQGLVGAPIDPRYVPSTGEVGWIDPTPMDSWFPRPLLFSYLCTILMFIWGFIFKHRAKLIGVTFGIILTAFLTGFFAIDLRI